MSIGATLSKLFFKRVQLVMVYLFLLVLILISGFLNRRFLSLENFSNLLSSAVPYLLIAFAQTIILIVGGIDLSVGSIVSLSNVLCARFMGNTPFGFIPGLVLALAAGAAAGFANGIIITRGRLQPIIVTLSSSSIIAGLALAILPVPGGVIPSGFARIVNGSMDVPVPLMAGIFFTVFLWIVLNMTKFGRSVYAIGGSENAAYSSGVAIDRIKMISYIISGLLSAFAGIYISSQIYSGDPLLGANMSLVSITTAVLGGTILGGGKGNIIGSIAGVFIFIIINNVLNLTGVSSFYQFILQGSLLIFALTIGSLRIRRRY